ncbi:MAG: glycoside hydrolase family 97 catalytic domain-containing protein, partial [Prolixibacteraceae bacterium]|nr:glycoside hydrolase family 97 catalytic domain-containing protein [Prolixibacteraceae bacterium]
MQKYFFYAFFLFFFACYSCSSDKESSVASPDGALTVKLFANTEGHLLYQVLKNNEVVIQPSRLGIIREDADFAAGLEITGFSEISEVEDSYTLAVRKKEKYSYKANQLSVSVKNAGGEQMDVIFQVSNTGVAFRYYFPTENTEVKKITNEITAFAFSTDSKAWLQPCAHAKSSWGNANPSYEEYYQQNIPVGTATTEAGWVFPALFKTGNNWVLISEVGLERNYCASRLHAQSPNGVYEIDFPQDKEVVYTGELFPESTLPWYSPWRIIVVGSLADIVESSLGTDVAKPAIAGDFSWVKAGRASWSWVLLKDEATVFPIQQQFVDYASDMGWEYCLVDGYWDTQIGYEKIQELIDYANTKNVKIILWYNSAGDYNTTPITPKSALVTHEDRIKEFTRIKNMGVAGIKVDFWGGDGQSVMNHYNDLLTDAAQVGLMVNCHGSTLPRGIHRTYPNLVSMEAIKGMEFLTFDQNNTNVQPEHCAMIPFTRNVFDPMDFTPVCFGEIPNLKRVTSNGFELALAVLFQSGVQHYAEIPQVMDSVPAYVKQTMKDIPAVWDETKLIDGFPAEFVVMARRAGSKWFIGGINALKSNKKITIDLASFNKNKGTLITDGSTNREFAQSDINLGENKTIEVDMKPNGGFV